MLPSILHTLEGAGEFSETIVFCALVKNEKNLPGPAEILKAFEGFPFATGKALTELMLTQCGHSLPRPGSLLGREQSSVCYFG